MTLTQYKGVARSRIAFSSDRDAGTGVKEVYLADYDGFNPRRLTVTRSLNIFPSWSGDGRTIAYVSYRNYTASILRAFIYEGRSDNITARLEGNFAAPSFCPDGKRIAYAAMRGGNAEIMVASVDGGNPHRLTSSPGVDTAPSWSPTGREIAFTSDRSGAQRIWIMDDEGLNTRRLTGVDSDAPAWNPSREFGEIAFTARLEGSFQIAAVDLATGQVRQISEGMGSCEYPAWSPNGRHLVFACRQGGRWQLTMTDRMGRNVKTLPMPGNNVYPDWGP
jgi:TolB protein